MIDLAPDQLETVRRILSVHVPDCEVRAFGSRAIWEASGHSDLDLAIAGNEPLGIGVMARLREAFEESDLPIRVDVIDWNAITDSFRGAIESESVVIRQSAGPAGWREIQLSDAIEVKPKRALTRGADAPFLAMADLPANQRTISEFGTREYTGSGARFQNGDTLLARITPCLENGKTAWVSGLPMRTTGHGSTEFIVLSAIDGRTHPEFVYYLARSPQFRSYAIGQMTGTSGRQRVPTGVVESFTFHIPPLEEQGAIAHVLGALDDKIELNRRMSETLDEMAQTLFRSWFVNFEPVRAKTECRPSGLPPTLDELFPDSFESSALGRIPAGWQMKTLGDVINVNPRRSIRRGDVATHVEMAAMPTSGPQVRAWTRRAFTSGSRFIRGDTLLARITPSLENGKTALVDFLDVGETGWGSTEFIVLRPKHPWPPEIAYVLARQPDFREHAIVNMTGTSGRQRVPTEAVAAYMLAVPPSPVAKAFGDLVQPWFERATCLGRQSRSLATLRDALLTQLISGKLRLKGKGQSLAGVHE